jgi:hypothetical protein
VLGGVVVLPQGPMIQPAAGEGVVFQCHLSPPRRTLLVQPMLVSVVLLLLLQGGLQGQGLDLLCLYWLRRQLLPLQSA